MKKLIAFLLSLSVGLLWVASGDTAQVLRFSPEGAARDIRQVSVQFSGPMVPLGDPRLEDPFTVECAAPGRGRWVDEKTWVYDFEQGLSAGLVCAFELKTGLKDLAGSPLGGQKRFSFNTGGPTVRESRPEEGGGRIDERQVFILTLDAEPDEASVRQHVTCSVEGVLEQIGVRLIQGQDLEQLFRALKIKKDKTPRLALQCRQTFPHQSEVKIVWGRGVKSVSGVPTAEDQVLRFKTRTPFLAKLVGKKEKPQAGFIPLLPMKLTFSAPIPWETAKQSYLKSQTGKIWKPQPEEGSGPIVDRVVFNGPFPENQSFTVHLPGQIKDNSGRLLANRERFPLTVKTDRYPSLAKFPSRFGIIEWDGGGLLPLTVRNLEAELKAWMIRPGEKSDKADEPVPLKTTAPTPRDDSFKSPSTLDLGQNIKGKFQRLGVQEEGKIIDWLHLLRAAKRKTSVFKGRGPLQKLSIPKTGSAKAFEVLGVPFQEPGFYVVELESEILGSRLLAKPAPFYVPAGVLATNLAAHFKRGRASSLVWVTSLDKGDPVAGAAVTIRDCSGRSLWKGNTDENGLAPIATALPAEDQLPRCRDRQEVEEYTPALSGTSGGLFVFARAGRDLTFTHSSWNQGIEPWRFNVPTGPYGDRLDLLAHTVFDRTLFRAGEDVHMKHYVRKRSPRGLSIPSETEKLKALVVVHAGGGQEYVFPLKWRPNGTAETVFRIPGNAKLGTYEVFLAGETDPVKPGSGPRINSGSFRVEAFRVPLMRGIIRGPREPVIQASEVEVDLSVHYLSGGGAANLPVKIRTEISPKLLRLSRL